MPRIPYPPFRCGTTLYNINKYNFLFYIYHSLRSRARHLYGVESKLANLSLWAEFCMGLIYSSPMTPLPLLCLYRSKLGPSFVADGPSSAKLPSFVGQVMSFVDLYFFLTFTTSNRPSDLCSQRRGRSDRNNGDLTRVISMFVLWSAIIIRAHILKCNRMYIVQSKVYELTQILLVLQRDFMSGHSVYLDRSKQ